MLVFAAKRVRPDRSPPSCVAAAFLSFPLFPDLALGLFKKIRWMQMAMVTLTLSIGLHAKVQYYKVTATMKVNGSGYLAAQNRCTTLRRREKVKKPSLCVVVAVATNNKIRDEII
jgi:hypothetical protein